MTVRDKYKCDECGWIGTEDDMGADATGGVDENWSNHICGGCGGWYTLEDYTKVEEENKPCSVKSV